MEPGEDVVAFARRPPFDLEQALARPGPVIFLEEPRHLGNLGAAIRVAAAADAAAVLTSGTSDPWHPARDPRRRRAAVRAPGRARR